MAALTIFTQDLLPTDTLLPLSTILLGTTITPITPPQLIPVAIMPRSHSHNDPHPQTSKHKPKTVTERRASNNKFIFNLNARDKVDAAFEEMVRAYLRKVNRERTARANRERAETARRRKEEGRGGLRAGG